MHNGILLRHRKEWNIAIFSNVNGPRNCHMSEVRVIWYLLYAESKRKGTNELIYKIKTDLEIALMVTSGGGIDWEFGMDMYTLLYLKQITNKDIPYSTGDSAQYSVII